MRGRYRAQYRPRMIAPHPRLGSAVSNGWITLSRHSPKLLEHRHEVKMVMNLLNGIPVEAIPERRWYRDLPVACWERTVWRH